MFFQSLFFGGGGGLFLFLGFKVCVYLSLREGYVQWVQDAKDVRGPCFPSSGVAEGCHPADIGAGNWNLILCWTALTQGCLTHSSFTSSSHAFTHTYKLASDYIRCCVYQFISPSTQHTNFWHQLCREHVEPVSSFMFSYFHYVTIP